MFQALESVGGQVSAGDARPGPGQRAQGKRGVNGGVHAARAAAVAEPGRRRGLRGMLCKLSQCSCAKALSFIFSLDLSLSVTLSLRHESNEAIESA